MSAGKNKSPLHPPFLCANMALLTKGNNMTTKHEFSIQYDDGKFWKDTVSGDSQVQMESLLEFDVMDKLADGFKWSMAVKGKGQRKRHNRSVMTQSVVAMLDYVKWELKQDAQATVYVLTPDVEIIFYA